MTNYSKVVKPSLKDLNIYLILLFPVTLIAGPLITEISILGIIILLGIICESYYFCKHGNQIC